MDPNPFESPQLPSTPQVGDPQYDPRRVGLAKQVRIVAVLTIIHGAALALLGIGYLIAAFVVGDKFADDINRQQQLNPKAQQLSPDVMRWIVHGTYGGIGAVMSVASVLGIFAGIRNYSFRGRVLGIIAQVCGMATILTCVCFPFSLGLLVYGLIIYLGPDAEAAFRWQEARSQRPAV